MDEIDDDNQLAIQGHLFQPFWSTTDIPLCLKHATIAKSYAKNFDAVHPDVEKSQILLYQLTA